MRIITLTIFALIIVVSFYIGWERSWDNKCEYWKTLDMTDAMRELCPEN